MLELLIWTGIFKIQAKTLVPPLEICRQKAPPISLYRWQTNRVLRETLRVVLYIQIVCYTSPPIATHNQMKRSLRDFFNFINPCI